MALYLAFCTPWISRDKMGVLVKKNTDTQAQFLCQSDLLVVFIAAESQKEKINVLTNAVLGHTHIIVFV